MHKPVSRSLALTFGLFLAISGVARLVWPKFDTLVWLIDVRRWPATVAMGTVFGTSALLIAYSIKPRMGRWQSGGAVAALTMLGLVTMIDAARAMSSRSRRCSRSV